MAFAEARSGDVTVSDGAPRELRLGSKGELFTSESVGKYYEIAKRGQLFHASMQAGSALGVALTATAVTLTLYNPSTSTVNLAVLQCGISITTQQVTTATVENIVYAANVDPSAAIPATTTSATIRPGLLGLNAGQGKAFTAATLPAAPVVVRPFPLAAFMQITTQIAQPNLAAIDNIDGAISLAPNTCLTIQGLATTTGVSGIVSFTWAELPR